MSPISHLWRSNQLRTVDYNREVKNEFLAVSVRHPEQSLNRFNWKHQIDGSNLYNHPLVSPRKIGLKIQYCDVGHRESRERCWQQCLGTWQSIAGAVRATTSNRQGNVHRVGWAARQVLRNMSTTVCWTRKDHVELGIVTWLPDW